MCLWNLDYRVNFEYMFIKLAVWKCLYVFQANCVGSWTEYLKKKFGKWEFGVFLHFSLFFSPTIGRLGFAFGAMGPDVYVLSPEICA